jgi:hypothetical protein
MKSSEIARLATQMIAVEKDPDNAPLARKHGTEWQRLPWPERALVVAEVKRIEASGAGQTRT